MSQPQYPAQAQPYPQQPYPQQPYPQQPYPQQPYPQQVAPQYPNQQYPPQQSVAYPAAPYPTAQPAGAVACRICGCVPAAPVTFRAHRGMIILMTFRRAEGPFCRDCGLATFRQMTADSLIQGWWGYASSVINTFTVLINLVRRGKVADLEAPRPPMDGRPYRRPLDPGPALFARPTAIIGAALPLVGVLLIVLLIAIGASSS